MQILLWHLWLAHSDITWHVSLLDCSIAHRVCLKDLGVWLHDNPRLTFTVGGAVPWVALARCFEIWESFDGVGECPPPFGMIMFWLKRVKGKSSRKDRRLITTNLKHRSWERFSLSVKNSRENLAWISSQLKDFPIYKSSWNQFEVSERISQKLFSSGRKWRSAKNSTAKGIVLTISQLQTINSNSLTQEASTCCGKMSWERQHFQTKTSGNERLQSKNSKMQSVVFQQNLIENWLVLNARLFNVNCS